MVLDTAQLIPNKVSKMAKTHVLPYNIETLLAVVKNEEHLVVLQIKLEHGTTVAYDGIEKNSADIWKNHDENIRGCFQIDQFKKNWNIRKSDMRKDLPGFGRMEQTHPYDCGPMAGAVMWRLLDCNAGLNYVVKDTNSTRSLIPSLNIKDWRRIIVAELRQMLDRCVLQGDKCVYRLPKKAIGGEKRDSKKRKANRE